MKKSMEEGNENSVVTDERQMDECEKERKVVGARMDSVDVSKSQSLLRWEVSLEENCSPH